MDSSALPKSIAAQHPRAYTAEKVSQRQRGNLHHWKKYFEVISQDYLLHMDVLNFKLSGPTSLPTQTDKNAKSLHAHKKSKTSVANDYQVVVRNFGSEDLHSQFYSLI